MTWEGNGEHMLLRLRMTWQVKKSWECPFIGGTIQILKGWEWPEGENMSWQCPGEETQRLRMTWWGLRMHMVQNSWKCTRRLNLNFQHCKLEFNSSFQIQRIGFYVLLNVRSALQEQNQVREGWFCCSPRLLGVPTSSRLVLSACAALVFSLCVEALFHVWLVWFQELYIALKWKMVNREHLLYLPSQLQTLKKGKTRCNMDSGTDIPDKMGSLLK